MLNKVLQAGENDTDQKHITSWKSEDGRVPEKKINKENICKQRKYMYYSYRIKRTIIWQK